VGATDEPARGARAFGRGVVGASWWGERRDDGKRATEFAVCYILLVLTRFR